MLQNTYDSLDELLEKLEDVGNKLHTIDDDLPNGYELPLILKTKLREIFDEVLSTYSAVERDHDEILRDREDHRQHWEV